MSKSKTSNLQKLENEVVELTEKWKRSVADYQNLQKRTEQEKQVVIEFANSTLIKDLLPVLDNLKLASDHSDDMGVKMVYEQFVNTLKQIGVENLDIIGKEFDPQTMEAIETKGNNLENKKKIVTKINKEGFSYKGRLLRAAQVTVKFE